MTTLERFGPLASRTALAAIFLCSGVSKLADPAGTGGYIASKGLAYGAFLALCAGLLEVAGGTALLLGLKTRWGALALAAFLVPATAIFHNPSGLEGMAAQMEMIQVLKNLAIGGGLLALSSFGPGPYSLEAKLAARHVHRGATRGASA